jgi:hypothetical protein
MPERRPMNTLVSILRPGIIVVGLLSTVSAFARPVSLYTVDGTGPDGTVNARIYASFEAHAHAAARWYRQALDGARVNTAGFTPFRRRMETATFVSFTYYYHRDGVEHSRVYHAMSGRSDFNGEMYVPRGQSRAQTVRAALPYPAFFTYAPGEVVTWDIEPLPDSPVTHSPVGDGRHPDARRRDAELKIARKIELDIANGTVASGGALYGFSSQVPCLSCHGALQALSDGHDIDVTVTYLEPRSRAYTRFHRQREQYVNSIHVAVNGGQMNLLRQESSVERAPLPVVDCVEEASESTTPSPSTTPAVM